MAKLENEAAAREVAIRRQRLKAQQDAKHLKEEKIKGLVNFETLLTDAILKNMKSKMLKKMQQNYKKERVLFPTEGNLEMIQDMKNMNMYAEEMV